MGAGVELRMKKMEVDEGAEENPRAGVEALRNTPEGSHFPVFAQRNARVPRRRRTVV